MRKTAILVLCLSAAIVAVGEDVTPIGAAPNARFATDAYPGFDSEDKFVNPERKEPKWFSFINGPNRDDARSQFEYCRELEAAERWSKAAKHYDALVREWPTSSVASTAQLRLAQIREAHEEDFEAAFEEYRYMLDFYSLKCDYNAVADKLWDLACKLREEGKTIMFFRFKNTVYVRRAFEAAVLRAPGAKWTAKAMLEIADLREEEGKDEEAVKVYENLRNIHYGEPEAKASVVREAAARMRLLRSHGYNRDRCIDTLAFMEQALKMCEPYDAEAINGYAAETKAILEDEAYRAAKFYDSKMRTRRSAINAYERFIAEYPESARADEVRSRIEELKGDEK